MKVAGLKHPVTPDGRYFVVRGKLWRMSNPNLDPLEKSRLVTILMNARRAVKGAKSTGDREAEAGAHHTVDEAKRNLGERGPVWWADGAPDFNRHAVRTVHTPIGICKSESEILRSWLDAIRIVMRGVEKEDKTAS